MKNLKILITNKPFTLNLINMVISCIGNRLTFLVIIKIMMFGNFQVLGVGAVSIIKILPMVLFSAFVGKFVDHSNRATILIWTDVLEGITVLSLIFFQNPIYVLIIFLFNCTIDIFADVALFAYYEQILEKEEIPIANSIQNGVGSIINILGPVIAAIIVAAFNNETAFFIDSMTFFIGAICTILCKYYYHKSGDVKNIKKDKESLKTSYKIVSKNKKLKYILLILVVVTFITEPQGPLMFIFGEEYLNLNVSQSSLFISAIGVGAFIASAISLKKAKLVDNMNAILTVVMLDGLALIILTNIKSFIVALICFGFFGVTSTIFGLTIRNTIQLDVSEEDIGKVYAFKNMIISPIKVISMILGSLLVMYFTTSINIFKYSGFLEVTFALIISIVYFHGKSKSKKTTNNTYL